MRRRHTRLQAIGSAVAMAAIAYSLFDLAMFFAWVWSGQQAPEGFYIGSLTTQIARWLLL